MPNSSSSHAGLVFLLAIFLPLNPSGEVVVSENLGRPAYSASGFYGPFEPSLAFDGEESDARQYWNSGNYAPQWVEVDLQHTYLLSRVRFVVAQLPDGVTGHEIWASRWPMKADISRAFLVGSFNDSTEDREVLDFRLVHPAAARFVQIRTTQSPSWVAWMDVQVFAAPSS